MFVLWPGILAGVPCSEKRKEVAGIREEECGTWDAKVKIFVAKKN